MNPQSSLSGQFRALAEQFRRILQQSPANAGKATKAAAQRGGRLLAAAAKSGVLEKYLESTDGLKTAIQELGEGPIPESAWLAFMTNPGTEKSCRLAPNPIAFEFSQTAPGCRIGSTSKGDWNIRAEASIQIADWLADAVAESTNNESASFSPAKARRFIAVIDDIIARIPPDGNKFRDGLFWSMFTEVNELAKDIGESRPIVAMNYRADGEDLPKARPAADLSLWIGFRRPYGGFSHSMVWEKEPIKKGRLKGAPTKRYIIKRERIDDLAATLQEWRRLAQGLLEEHAAAAMNSVPKSPPVVEPPLSRNPPSRPVAATESPIERLRDAIGDVVFFGGRGDRDELWTASERMGIATHAAFTNRPDIVSATVAKQLEAARRGFVDACCTCAIYSRDCENREQSQQRVLDSAKDAKSAYGKALVDLQEWLRVEQLYPSALTKTALDEHAAEPTTGDLSPLGTETPSADATPKGATEQQSPAKLAKLKRCEQKAYLAYKFATEKLEVRPNELIDNEVYKWLSEESLPDNLFDGADKYELPSFDTWTKYLRKVRRELGESKYNRRSPTTTTRSVVQYRDLDSPCDD